MPKNILTIKLRAAETWNANSFRFARNRASIEWLQHPGGGGLLESPVDIIGWNHLYLFLNLFCSCRVESYSLCYEISHGQLSSNTRAATSPLH